MSSALIKRQTRAAAKKEKQETKEKALSSYNWPFDGERLSAQGVWTVTLKFDVEVGLPWQTILDYFIEIDFTESNPYVRWERFQTAVTRGEFYYILPWPWTHPLIGQKGVDAPQYDMDKLKATWGASADTFMATVKTLRDDNTLRSDQKMSRIHEEFFKFNPKSVGEPVYENSTLWEYAMSLSKV